MATDSQEEADGKRRAEQYAEPPAKLPRRAWTGVLRRTVSEFSEDNLTDWAAALTYYGIGALFPALIALVSILGLIGPSATKPLLDNLGSFAPGPAHQILSNALHGLTQSRGSAGLLFVVGLVGALWSASGYIGAFIRASNAIWEVREGRKFYILRPLQILITIVGVLLVTLIALSLIISGPVAKAIGDAVDLGDTAVTAWNVVKWPIIVIVVSMMVAALYHIAPNVKQPRFRWFTVGGFLALLVWVVASVGFAFHVALLSPHTRTD